MHAADRTLLLAFLQLHNCSHYYHDVDDNYDYSYHNDDSAYHNLHFIKYFNVYVDIYIDIYIHVDVYKFVILDYNH